jgi:hypothetical protein
LEPPYSGPYKVLSRREKTLQLVLHDIPQSNQIKEFMMNWTSKSNEGDKKYTSNLGKCPLGRPRS